MQFSRLRAFIDIYPTLCDLAGLNAPEYISGKSLVPLLENRRKKVRQYAFTQSVFEGYSMVNRKYRYTRWGEGGDGMIELYDRRTDPGEMKNLASDTKYIKIIQKLDKEITGKIGEAGEKPKGMRYINQSL